MVCMSAIILKNVFSKETFDEIKKEVTLIRSVLEYTPMHDQNAFFRWQVHKPPFAVKIHHSDFLKELANKIFPIEVKPSYSFLSMYSENGICPGHIDRAQCVYTIDLCVNQKEPWPIYIGKNQTDYVGEEFFHNENEAVCYSGTGQWHYRNRIQPGNKVDMLFFHFVPISFNGSLD